MRPIAAILFRYRPPDINQAIVAAASRSNNRPVNRSNDRSILRSRTRAHARCVLYISGCITRIKITDYTPCRITVGESEREKDRREGRRERKRGREMKRKKKVFSKSYSELARYFAAYGFAFHRSGSRYRGSEYFAAD